MSIYIGMKSQAAFLKDLLLDLYVLPSLLEIYLNAYYQTYFCSLMTPNCLEIKTEDDVELLQHAWSQQPLRLELWMNATLPTRKVLKIHNKWKECNDYTYTMKKYDGNTTTFEKDIGVNIDSNLLFDKHIQILVNSANQTVGIICWTFCSFKII